MVEIVRVRRVGEIELRVTERPRLSSSVAIFVRRVRKRVSNLLICAVAFRRKLSKSIEFAEVRWTPRAECGLEGIAVRKVVGVPDVL